MKRGIGCFAGLIDGIFLTWLIYYYFFGIESFEMIPKVVVTIGAVIGGILGLIIPMFTIGINTPVLIVFGILMFLGFRDTSGRKPPLN